MRKRIPTAAIAAVLLVVLVAAVAGVFNAEEKQRAAVVATLHVDGPDRDRARDDVVKVPLKAVKIEAQAEELERPLDRAPAGVPADQLRANAKQLDELARKDADFVRGFGFGASGQQRGCATHFVRNQSARVTRPRTIVWHYTVSPNLPGVRDLLGLTARANDPGAGVSWHYAIDRDGNCFYNVPEERKAWHVAAGNSLSIGIEVVNTGSEPSYMSPAGYRKLALVTRDAAHRWRIPLQKGAIRNCQVVRPGVVTHEQWGACGGGHHDISPYPFSRVYSAVLGAGARSCLHRGERTLARRAVHPKGSGHSERYWNRRARARATAIYRAAHRHKPPAWKAHRRGCRYQKLARAAR